MSSSSEIQEEFENAEASFRAAFVRLVDGCPRRLPIGTPVTQNNVAREAGRDPSAFKKKRYPALIRQIQEYLARVAETAPAAESCRPETGATLQMPVPRPDEAIRLREERDSLLVQLLAAKQRIFEQWQRIQRLERSADTVIENLDDWREGGISAKAN